MELNDCAFPTLAGVICTDNPSLGFKDVKYALLIGAKPRGRQICNFRTWNGKKGPFE